MTAMADACSMRMTSATALRIGSAQTRTYTENAAGTEEYPPYEKNADQCHAARRIAGCAG